MSFNPIVKLLDRAKQEFFDNLMDMLEDASGDERLELMKFMEAKFCRRCGRALNGTKCHCRSEQNEPT